MRSVRRLGVLLAIGVGGLGGMSASVTEASAQEGAPPSAPSGVPSGSWGRAAVLKEQARALTHKGDELYDDGKFQEAYYFYNEAMKRFAAPPIVFSMAQCLVKLGRMMEAKALLSNLVEEQLPPSSPREFIQAQAEGSVELAKLRLRIPKLRITVTDAPEKLVRVTMDGKDVPHLDQAFDVDPGEHLVVARVEGGGMVASSVLVTEATTKRLEISLLPSVLNPRRSLAPAIAAFGVGAVGLGVGLVTGILAVDRDAPGLTAASMIGLGIGGMGVGAGATLLLVRSTGWSGHSGAELARSAPRGAGVMLRGTF